MVTGLYPKSDMSSIFVVAKAAATVVDTFTNTEFSKRGADLTPEWSKHYNFIVEADSSAMDSAEAYIYFTTFDASSGWFGRISTSDGAVQDYHSTDPNLNS